MERQASVLLEMSRGIVSELELESTREGGTTTFAASPARRRPDAVARMV